MRIPPQEPTAALAALITGNHRFLREPVSVAPWRPLDGVEGTPQPGRVGEPHDPPAQGGVSGRSFALVWSREEGLAVAREVFGFGLGGRSGEDGLSVVASGGPRSATGTEGAGGIEDAFAVTEVPLVVVVARLESRLAALEAAWARAESRVFDGIRRLIGEACGVREAIASGRTRVVGALVEDESGRVHWLGELPEQERMLAVDR